MQLLRTERQGHHLIVQIPPHWNGLTIEHVLQDLWQVPKKIRHEWRMERAILLNNKPVPFHEILKKGDRLSVPVFTGPESNIEPQVMDLSVLFEDDHFLIVNKNAGLATHPNHPDDRNTLLNGVYAYLKEKDPSGSIYIQHVHRLDQDTTGAILFAKHPLAKSMLDRLLAERKVVRTYNAIVTGILEKDAGTIRAKIGRDRHHPTKRRVSKTGKTAITHYRVIGHDRKRKLTLVECRLETGRTHQIRVHFAHMGHPLAGDKLYGGKSIFPRPALHARTLAFDHPFTGQRVHVKAPYLDQPPIFPDELTRQDV